MRFINSMLSGNRKVTSSKSRRSGRSTVNLNIESLEDRVLLDHALGQICCVDHDHLGGEAEQRYQDFVTKSKWNNKTITYSFSNLLDGRIKGLTTGQVRAAIEEALGLWASYAPLQFVEAADSGPAPADQQYTDLGYPTMRFGHRYIDGDFGKNVLAVGYFPANTGLAGDVHFDNGNNWRPGYFLETAVHEIGHALGLMHETVNDAIMNPSNESRYGALGDAYLLQDDVNGIHALYGAGTGSVTPMSTGVGTATPIAPSGTAQTNQPTFTWKAGSNATWHRLYVYNYTTRRLAIDQWVQQNTSFTPGSGLAEGQYGFWVQSWGNGKYGDWSGELKFSIQSIGPETAVLSGPSGSQTDNTPTFSWNNAKNATWYRLYVANNDTGKVVVDKWLQTTSHTATSALANGQYGFWVQTWGNGKYGEWSNEMKFKIEAGVGQSGNPETAVLNSPSQTTTDTTPTFRWSNAKNATWYRLYVYSYDLGKPVIDTWVQATEFTSNSFFAKGNYVFWVQTWGNGLYGEWSEAMDFTIV